MPSRPAKSNLLPANTPVPLAEVLAELFWRRGWRRVEARRRLESAWERVVGAELAGRLRLGAWRRGVLEIVSSDAALVHRLAHFDGRLLLEQLQQQLGPGLVTGLRFRLG